MVKNEEIWRKIVILTRSLVITYHLFLHFHGFFICIIIRKQSSKINLLLQLMTIIIICRMFLQQEILQWVHSFNVNQLKQLLTLKSPYTLNYIRKILTHLPDCKPIDRISHGYSQTTVQNQKGFYVRDSFRYKKKKQQKIAMQKILFENITVSRISPCSFSVKKSFIKNEKLKQCMLLFSNEQLFNYYAVKQIHIKLGGEKTPRSIWFDPSHIASFCEWLIYLFEIEIFEAFQTCKKDKKNGLSTVNHFTFVEENFNKKDISKYIDNILILYSEKKHSGKYAKKSTKMEGLFGQEEEEDFGIPLEVTHEEVPYIATRCLDKFEKDEDRGAEEVIFEYEWYSEDRKSKVNRILREVCRIIVKKFKDYEIDLKVKEIEALSQSKKKKKRSKKGKQQIIQDLEKTQQKRQIQQKREEEHFNESTEIANSQNEPKQEEKIKTPNLKEADPVIEDLSDEIHPNDNKEIKQKKSVDSKEQKSKEKNKKNAKNKPKNKHKKEQSLQKIQAAEKQENFIKAKKVNIDRQKQQAKKSRKLVKQRINQHIFLYYQQLYLSSQIVDKYRKICIETIQHALNDMNLKVKWEMLVFGSYSIQFALKESDLDILIVVEEPDSLSLHQIQEYLKVQEWLKDCNIIQIQSAKVPILQFKIILSCLKHPILNKDHKKPKDVIHVDLSLTHNKLAHEGVRNTALLKQIFTQHPTLRIVSLVFKQLLRIYELNQPFRGGIGSFVLSILIHNIIKIKKVEINEDYYLQMLEVCSFMTESFEPFQALISPYKDTHLKPNPKQELNVEDPEDKVLLNTSKIRQINEIIQLFNQFKMLLTSIETELNEINPEQRKKMKRLFFQKWNTLFKPHEEHLEAEK